MRVHVHPCCGQWPARLNPRTQRQDVARAQVLSGRRVRPLKFSRWSPRRNTLHMLVTQCASRRQRLARLRQNPRAKVERSVVVGGLGVVLLDYGEDAEGEPASESEGELVKRRQNGQKHWRPEGVSVCARRHQTWCRCSRHTWNGARKLDPKSRATSIISCGAAPVCAQWFLLKELKSQCVSVRSIVGTPHNQ